MQVCVERVQFPTNTREHGQAEGKMGKYLSGRFSQDYEPEHNSAGNMWLSKHKTAAGISRARNFEARFRGQF